MAHRLFPCLQPCSPEHLVLRSFASIFADEDAMLETMTGKNNALEKNNTFIDYVEKNTSTTKTNDSSKKV